MRTQLYDGSRKIQVDTRLDNRLYAAPRPQKYSPEVQRQGKDLYMHKDKEGKITYYMHLWSTVKTIRDKILPISPASAERYLRGKGLVCTMFPESDAIGTLYRWGYGIAEEF